MKSGTKNVGMRLMGKVTIQAAVGVPAPSAPAALTPRTSAAIKPAILANTCYR